MDNPKLGYEGLGSYEVFTEQDEEADYALREWLISIRFLEIFFMRQQFLQKLMIGLGIGT